MNQEQFSVDDLHAAHLHSSRHRAEIDASDRCGCFYCKAMFAPSDISEWTDNDQTALCPKCKIDAVLGAASGITLTPEFMTAMNEHWF
ncbi:cytoplasmic protein [Nodularia spumigena]|jgi:NAD-dependent SIR2 family protein deacetylase|uniref:cytoplasmic protein n=1 Tax=Nodularia spumigena TaxID=70799 RepID=UPI002B213A28|nr:cytoplasmic protein [Nodularia spumigena]MEA5615411.1 cytoplasmic protein [Nodularia spumigena UHCC 0040]